MRKWIGRFVSCLIGAAAIINPIVLSRAIPDVFSIDGLLSAIAVTIMGICAEFFITNTLMERKW